MRNGKDRDRDREHREHRDRDRNEHGWSNSNEAAGDGNLRGMWQLWKCLWVDDGRCG